MKTLIHPTYLPNIATSAILVQQAIVWEMHDNFQKQTYRNRCYICTDRGKLMLNIPIQHVGKNQGRQKYKDVKIDHSYHWQRQHWRTLETAYRTSPYFEFYEDDIMPLFHKKTDFLLDFNLETISVISTLLEVNMPTLKTDKFEKTPLDHEDLRYLVEAKKEFAFEQNPYEQVFGDRHGFIKNASVLDLLFNEGPNTTIYLKSLNIGQ